MNNIIHRNQSLGSTTRKVIPTDKSPYLTKESDPEPVIPAVETPVLTTEEIRAQKRIEYSALERSRKLEAEAKDKLKRAEQLAQAYQSNDLDQIAKAHQMSTSDYVRWVNTKAIGAPTDKPLTPQEQLAHNAQQWQQQMTQDMQEQKNFSNSLRKDSYINKNILPHLVKNPEKYELLHDKGMDQVASEIYDYMNLHFQETGGKEGGEELDPVSLLDAYEERLTSQELERLEKAKKFKKLQPSASPMAKVIPVKGEAAISTEDMLAQTLASEDALAEAAPSNLVAGPSRGSTEAKGNKTPSFITGGTTPKNSKFNREARLAMMSKERGE